MDINITPAQDIQQVCKTAKPGDTIYLRAGTYRNADWRKPFAGRTKSSLALISLKGTEAAPIVIKNYPGDRVTIESDVTGFSLKACTWLTVEGIEFKGCTDTITWELASDLWWVTDERLSQTGASGISINGCFHVNVKNCVIHSWPGSGITENYSEYIKVEGNVIAHNGRWSVSGVHGFNNSKPGTGRRENETDLKFEATGNLVVGNQQCIPSRVTSKGFADLRLDEGGGLHSQASTITADGGTVFGRWEITNNLVMFCGRSGINQNATGNLLIERNSLYQNVQNTPSADIWLSPFTNAEASSVMAEPIVRNNLIHSLPQSRAFNRIGDSTKRYVGFGSNIILAGNPNNADHVANTSVQEVSAVFQDPVNGNFKRHPSVDSAYGADDATVQALVQKAADYAIALTPCPIKTDTAYMATLKQKIFDTWPDPSTIPEFGVNFELRDSEEKYTYAQRGEYPRTAIV
jgi:hypothetical protein